MYLPRNVLHVNASVATLTAVAHVVVVAMVAVSAGSQSALGFTVLLSALVVAVVQQALP